MLQVITDLANVFGWYMLYKILSNLVNKLVLLDGNKL